MRACDVLRHAEEDRTGGHLYGSGSKNKCPLVLGITVHPFAVYTMSFQGWLKPYLPAALTHAMRTLADHVDIVEEVRQLFPTPSKHNHFTYKA